MTAIDAKYGQLGGSAGFLGAATTPELPTPDGRGRFRHFQHGSIYWTPWTGAHEVHGQILAQWSAMGWERSSLGYPTTDETSDGDANPATERRSSQFERGTLVWNATFGTRLKQLPPTWKKVDAAITLPGDRVGFFSGPEYAEYDRATDTLLPPKLLAPTWPGVWGAGLDAALTWDDGKIYFFRGSEYLRFDLALGRVDAGYPRQIASAWRGLWPSDLDGAVNWGDGKAYFFRGAEYVRYDVARDEVDPGYPKPISGNWRGAVGGWSKGIDAGVRWGNGKVCFFKGREYCRFDVAGDSTDPGYPRGLSVPFDDKADWAVAWEVRAATTYPVPRFKPGLHGFHFANGFDNELRLLLLGNAIEAVIRVFSNGMGFAGRCGGMAYAALDYFKHPSVPLPAEAELPPDGSVCGEYIWQRLVKSLEHVAPEFVRAQTDLVHRDALWGRSLPPKGSAYTSVVEQLEKNTPCSLDLITTGFGLEKIGECHQVVAIGHTPSSDPERVLVHTYDNTCPDREMVLVLNQDKGYWEEHELVTLAGDRRFVSSGVSGFWRGFFPDLKYADQLPPNAAPPSRVTDDRSGADLRTWTPPAPRDLRAYAFARALFSGSPRLDFCDFDGVNAAGARFDGTLARFSNFRGARLDGAVFDAAHLGGSTFSGATAQGASFKNANLTGAVCSPRTDGSGNTPFTAPRADFGTTVLNRARLDGARLAHANFANSVADTVAMTDAALEGARFANASLNHADLTGAALADASFDHASLNDVQFVRAACDRADFTGARLAGVSFAGASLRNARFEGATLNAVDFAGVKEWGGSVWKGCSLANVAGVPPEVLPYLHTQGVVPSSGPRLPPGWTHVDSVVAWGGKAWFFRGDECVRYDAAWDRVEGAPQKIAAAWPGLWPSDVRGGVYWGDDVAYFFKGSEYVRFDLKQHRVAPTYPRPISGNWPGLWPSNIDAAVNWGDGSAYLFRGAEYVKYDLRSDRVVAGYPRPIASAWSGLWPSGLSAAVNWDNGKAFFFRGDSYARFDVAHDRVDPGYPRTLSS